MKEINSLAKEFESIFGWHQARLVLLSAAYSYLIELTYITATLKNAIHA